MRNNSKLGKKFIWDTSAEKESVGKIQGRNYDEGTEELREIIASKIKRYLPQREIYGDSMPKFGNFSLRWTKFV